MAQGIIEWSKELAPGGDSTFADDMAPTNLAAILQQYGLLNVRVL